MLERIDKNIFVVFTEDGFTYSNCILIDDELRMLIDSGAGSILPQVCPENIDLVVNSHHHIDHIRGNNMCPKAKILMHPLEHNSMQSLEEITATAGWEEVMNDHQLALSDLVSFSEKSGQAWRIDGSINDGDIIDCGTTKIVVLHTPGHSPGHCSFYFPDRELVFLGDICLTKVGPWYGDEKASINDFIDSIDRIIALRPRMMAAGHSSQIFTTPIVVPTLLEYRDRILKREQRIFSYLKSHTCNIDQLANQHLIYRDHPNIFVLFWEKYMIKKHLERLLETGCIEPVDDEQYHAV